MDDGTTDKTPSGSAELRIAPPSMRYTAISQLAIKDRKGFVPRQDCCEQCQKTSPRIGRTSFYRDRQTMASIPFSTLPYPADPSANLTPFSISVPDEELEDLKTLLRLSHIAAPNWENSHDDGFFGIPRDVLVDVVKHWQNGYDWRKWESTLNSFPQYTITIADDDGSIYTIHFLALFSPNPSAIPILLLHGWPGSVLEFLPLLQHVRAQHTAAPAELPYHVIVPHFVGYGFSSPPPRDRDFSHVDNARLVSKLMHALGFASSSSGYVVQGGDLGGATAPVVASLDPACRLVHVNMLNIPPPEGVDVEADV